jgi:signal transduction histidine kinase
VDRPRRRLEPHDAYLAALDVGAAVLLLALYWPGFGQRSAAPVGGTVEITAPPAWVGTWGIVAAVAVALPLVVRRRWPRTVLAVVLVASAAHALMLGTRWPFPAAALAMLTVALTTSRRLSVTWLGIGLATIAVPGALSAALGQDLVGANPAPSMAASTARWADPSVMTGVGALVLTAAWAIGRAVGAQRDYASAAAAQEANRVRAEERLRLARELHDIVTHSIGLVAVKAGVANHVADARPDEARDALRVIESTSRTALVELRRVLDVLRGGQAGGEALTPSPRLSDLPQLVQHAIDAGVRVELVVTGSADLPEAVELSAYRIAQEALTNVVRHAGPARCWVTVAVDEWTVAIDIVDDGRGGSGHQIGHGLTGMRERAGAYGGSFTAGPRPGGGFGVHATLPYAAPAGATSSAAR